MKLTSLLDRSASFTLVICSLSDISLVKSSPEPIHLIDSDIWLTRCIVGYSKCITHYSMVFRGAWMPIVSHQDSNSIKRIENSFLNHFCSFEVMQ